MAITTTAGRAMVNSTLPRELRDYNRTVMGGELEALLARVAKEHPDKYRDISHQLLQMGAKASYKTGATIRIGDLDAVDPAHRQEVFDFVDKQEKVINDSKELSDDEREIARSDLYTKSHKLLVDRTMEVGKANNNSLVNQVISKARGNPLQLTAMVASPGVYADAKGKVQPLFIKHSYAEGLTPAEYYTATYGARASVLSTKFATRNAGDLGKQMGTAANSLMVTLDDCGTDGGIEVPADDADNEGAFLARDYGGFSAGSPLDGKALKTFKKIGGNVIVRSATTCKAPRGICARCAGLNEKGHLPALGEAIGINATSALSERIAQSGLNAKHQGGQKATAGSQYAGFKWINQFAQVPETFQDRAPLANGPGQVSIVPAAQGGSYVKVGSHSHFVPAHLPLVVKDGDEVEAGDVLSEGLIDPAELVRYRGIGDGRKYYAERFTKMYRDSGMGVNRRNVEVLARAAIDHVKVDDLDGVGDFLPGDTASYSAIEAGYTARPDAKSLNPQQAIGRFLEAPVLHYTIGTPITKSVAAAAERNGVKELLTHNDAPGFSPEMERLRAVPFHKPDWIGKMQGSYLTQNLLSDVHTGTTPAQLHGTDPVPAIVFGTELGSRGKDRY